MKITNRMPTTSNVEGAKTSKAEGGKSSALSSKSQEAQVKARGAENVNVSERAQMMQKAKDIAGDGTVDEAKVARLQKLIDEGKYKTDARAIADRLVDEHLSIPD